MQLARTSFLSLVAVLPPFAIVDMYGFFHWSVVVNIKPGLVTSPGLSHPSFSAVLRGPGTITLSNLTPASTFASSSHPQNVDW